MAKSIYDRMECQRRKKKNQKSAQSNKTFVDSIRLSPEIIQCLESSSSQLPETLMDTFRFDCGINMWSEKPSTQISKRSSCLEMFLAPLIFFSSSGIRFVTLAERFLDLFRANCVVNPFGEIVKSILGSPYESSSS